MRRFLGIVALLILAPIAANQTAKRDQNLTSSDAARKNPCEELMPKTGAVISSWTANGVIVENSAPEKIYVREVGWMNAGNGGRVSIALAAFCIANMGGNGMLFVRSFETNKILMTVKDGQVYD